MKVKIAGSKISPLDDFIEHELKDHEHPGAIEQLEERLDKLSRFVARLAERAVEHEILSLSDVASALDFYNTLEPTVEESK